MYGQVFQEQRKLRIYKAYSNVPFDGSEWQYRHRALVKTPVAYYFDTLADISEVSFIIPLFITRFSYFDYYLFIA
jgi:hypothetical protein